ncbi:MAG: hypothetical protein ACYC26_17860, partial [Phycisphaerales bacterium]
MKPSRRLPRSGRFIAVGSFSVGLWNAVAWSVLIHAGVIGVALWTWDVRADQRATPLFAQGEQSVMVTNLRFISAAELEEMEHPRKLEPTLPPPPPEVIPPRPPPPPLPPKPETRNPKLPPPPPEAMSDERRATRRPKPPPPQSEIRNQKSETTPPP